MGKIVVGIDEAGEGNVFRDKIAECVGLWLAEGDGKTNSEITFTNNCFDLIKLFYERVNSLFPLTNYRLYVYLPNENVKFNKIPSVETRTYFDSRATKPYYILRVANVDVVSGWKILVKRFSGYPTMYQHILRGFFAGEGNIKTGSHSNRQLRIAQGKKNQLIETILRHLKIDFRYSFNERAYVISNRENWRIFAELQIADLHPMKRDSFWNTYNKFIEWHYSHNYIKNKIIGSLDLPKTSLEIAKEFGRSQSRLQRVLKSLKNENKIENFRSKSKTYWLNKNSGKIIISDVKLKYLNLLSTPKTTTQLSDELGVTWKSSHRRLKELEGMGLVRNSNYLWYKNPIKKGVIVL